MRKVFAILIAFLMFGVAACSGAGEKADTATTTTVTQDSASVTTTTIANLPTHKWEYEDVIITGEIVKVDFRTVWDDSVPGTALQIVDAEGNYYYLGLRRIMNVFEVGQQIWATYEVGNLYAVYDDGTRELVRTRNRNTKRSWRDGGLATKHNSDGSISFEKFNWILIDIENIVIIPS